VKTRFVGPHDCRVIRPDAEGGICGRPASCKITFSDGETALSCSGCALYIEQLASTYGTIVRVESMLEPSP
jgi:hypothetical protein